MTRQTLPAGSLPHRSYARRDDAVPQGNYGNARTRHAPPRSPFDPGRNRKRSNRRQQSRHEFVPDHHGDGDSAAGPRVPIENVNIGSADGGFPHSHEHVIDADFGHGNLFKP